MLPDRSPARAWAEINLSAFKHNLHHAHRAAGTPVMAVIKAGAYGHGLLHVAEALQNEPHLSHFGVANVGEARRLREAGIQIPIYILGASTPDERAEITHLHLTPCLSTLDEAQHFSQLAQKANTTLTAHLALDTGMGRGGLLPADAPALYEKILALPSLHLEGIGSHLASADEDPHATQQQIDSFHHTLDQLEKIRPFTHRHLFNSAGLLGFSDQSTRMTLARPGLMLYGASPLPAHQADLQTTLALKSRITLTRTLPAGHGISYGGTFVTTRPTRVATVGIGYGDGYPRSLSGKNTEVFLKGQRCPLIGRVTMDQIIIDITDLENSAGHNQKIQPGDEVELFGSNIPLAEISQKANTIPWEILTGITPRVERLYL